MLKRAFALSDQGAKDLAKGIIATACANLIQIIPASLLLMVVMMLLEKAAGTQVNVGRNIPFFVGITLVLFGMIAIAQLVQYNLTYTAHIRKVQTEELCWLKNSENFHCHSLKRKI